MKCPLCDNNLSYKDSYKDGVFCSNQLNGTSHYTNFIVETFYVDNYRVIGSGDTFFVKNLKTNVSFSFPKFIVKNEKHLITHINIRILFS